MASKGTMPKMDKVDKEYQAECDLRTLVEAEKIRKDKPRLTSAMKKRKEQIAALQKVDEKKGK